MSKDAKKISRKQVCPDFNGLSDEQLSTFWSTTSPTGLKWLGDRLLAECLPRFEARDESFYPALEELRVQAGLSLDEAAAVLDTNPFIIECWEKGTLRAPASLPLIYRNRKFQ